MEHVPLYWSELLKKFFEICAAVTGKRVNRGIGLGLVIPVDYFSNGDNRVMEWFKKSTEKLDKCTGVKVGKCMKKLVKSVHLLFCAFF